MRTKCGLNGVQSGQTKPRCPSKLCRNRPLARTHGFGAAYRNRTDDLRITRSIPQLTTVVDGCRFLLQVSQLSHLGQMAVDDPIRPFCVTSVSKEVINEPTLEQDQITEVPVRC